MGSNAVPATDPAKAAVAKAAGALVLDLVRKRPEAARRSSRLRLSKTRSPRWPRPAARPTPSSICSPSRGKPGSSWISRSSTAISASVPWLADLKPARQVRGDRPHKAGGNAVVAQAAASNTASSRPTRSRSRAGRSARKRAAAIETAGQQVVRPLANPLSPTGRSRDPAGQPRARRARREGRRSHAASATRARHACSTAKRRRSKPCRPARSRRRRRRHPLRRAEGRAGHARDARGHRRHRRRRPGR